MLGAGAMAQHVDGGATGACSWELTGSSNNYTLTITGTGAMANYSYETVPWYSYRTSIKTLVINEGVTSIGNYAFSLCSGLTGTLTIPEGVTSIGTYAFFFCSGLTGTLTIPDGVTSIGYGAFSGCSGLTGTLTIPESVTSIGTYAFSGCSSLTAINVDNANTRYSSIDGVFYNKTQDTVILCPAGKQGSVTIPNSVTSIGYGAFSGCSGLTEVTIPEGVTSIGDDAFSRCSGLTEVTIPNSVTSIEDFAFHNCSGLTEVTIPDGVTSIGYDAFSGCSGLTEVTIGNGVTSIGDWAFANCIGLTEVTIPNSVTSIGICAFRYCSGLTEITIPDGVTSIGDWAFADCSDLTEVTIGNSVTSIGEDAFEGTAWYENQPDVGVVYAGKVLYKYKGTMPANTSITVQEGTLGITERAFSGCSGLTSVTIPDGVTSIGDAAFEHCSGLTEITIPNSVTSIGSYAFYGCSGLTEVTIPNSVTSIGDGAFYYCSGLTEVTIPNSVTSIGGAAFYGCSGLTEITIPDGVTSIGSYAFSGCSKLDTVKVDWDNPPTMNTNIFGNPPNPALNKRTLLIPAGTTSLYAIVEPWSLFKQPFVEYLRSIADATVTIIGDTTYTSNAVKPTIEVQYSGMPLTEDADYTVSYSTETQAGSEVTITITGKGDYDGTKIKTFTIAKAAGTFAPLAAIAITYAEGLTLGDIDLPDNYVWQNPDSVLIIGNNQNFAAIYTEPSGNYLAAAGQITVNVAIAPNGDDDHDGIPNINDPDSPIYNLPGGGGADDDGDGIPNINDPNSPNYDLPGGGGADDDSDGIPNINDPDSPNYDLPGGGGADDDGDGIPNINDPDSPNYDLPGGGGNSDATLQNLSSTVGTLAPTFDPNTTHYTLLLPCGDSSITFTVTPADGGSATSPTGSNTITLLQPSIETFTIHSVAADGTTKKDYTVDVIRPFPASIIWQYWSSILAVNLNEKTNGGYTFTGFQWQQNGTDIDGATGAYLYLSTPPLATDSFGVALTIEGQTQALPACPQQFVPLKKINASLRAYPNPASNGQLTIDNVQWNAGDKVDIYNVNGTKVFETSLSIVHYPLSINIGHLPAGVYVVRVGEQSTIIVIK
ncbi:hypothetical protein AGMMS4956_02960 [Bacteroidia bacterium]|nr:hypothetical protein AGMMS4956_02960 [Bacteroidia bacterium]